MMSCLLKMCLLEIDFIIVINRTHPIKPNTKTTFANYKIISHKHIDNSTLP